MTITSVDCDVLGVTLCSLVGIYTEDEGETSVTTNNTARRHNPEDHNPPFCRYENLKSEQNFCFYYFVTLIFVRSWRKVNG
jgi:hypothetical protein